MLKQLQGQLGLKHEFSILVISPIALVAPSGESTKDLLH